MPVLVNGHKLPEEESTDDVIASKASKLTISSDDLTNHKVGAGGDADESTTGEGMEVVPASGTTDSAEEGAAEETNGEEVIVIQDTGFNIKIVAPGVEPFDLPVSLGMFRIHCKSVIYLSLVIG